MSRKILGIDIRRDSLAAVLINGTIHGQVIEALEYIDLSQIETQPENEMNNADPEDNGKKNPVPGGDERGESLLKMLELLSRKMDFEGTTCFVSFPSSDISYRNLSVPFRNKKKN